MKKNWQCDIVMELKYSYYVVIEVQKDSSDGQYILIQIIQRNGNSVNEYIELYRSKYLNRVMKKVNYDWYPDVTLESLHIESLSAEELQTLLPAANPKAEVLIRERIRELQNVA